LQFTFTWVWERPDCTLPPIRIIGYSSLFQEVVERDFVNQFMSDGIDKISDNINFCHLSEVAVLFESEGKFSSPEMGDLTPVLSNL
jgi:hypothetical protein